MTTFTAYVFDGKKTAQKVLHSLEDSSNDYSWIEDVAVVSRSKYDNLKINSTWAQDDLGSTGFGWGAFTGALLGSMAGPGGALAGSAAGGSLWGLFGAAMDGALDDPKLDAFAAKMKQDTSALVLVSDEGYMVEYETAMGPYIIAPYDGTIVQTDLNETDVDYIKKKIKESQS